MSDRLLKESDVLKIAFQLPLVVNSAFADAVKALPSADRPQGEWIITESHRKGQIIYHDYKCSICGHHRDRRMNYCEVCGAMMKGVDNEQMDI